MRWREYMLWYRKALLSITYQDPLDNDSKITVHVYMSKWKTKFSCTKKKEHASEAQLQQEACKLKKC